MRFLPVIGGLGLVLGCGVAGPVRAAEVAPTRPEVLAALQKAATFYRQNCAHYGGYGWRYSRDLKLSEGEGEMTPTMAWVQPPGTPSVGMAFLDAYEATREPFYLQAARDAALALVRGQRLSGGWYYSIEFDPKQRAGQGYRDNPGHRPPKSGRDLANLTMIDDDTTGSALRFLMRTDRALGFKEAAIKGAVDYALRSVMTAQFPCGAWHHNYDRWPEAPSPKEFPVIKATYPKAWSRTWDNAWTGRYQINDNITGTMLATMLLAHETYGEAKYLAAARRAGDFFLLAQMPDPQPGWAQQYDAKMQPVWERKFEPPAISGLESQYALESLLMIFRATGDAKYLEPFPRALAYLKKSLLKDGRLARFYELHSNKPLAFVVNGKRYDLTYDFSKVPDHYGFIHESRLGEIEAEYLRAKAGDRSPRPAPAPKASEVRAVLAAMDPRGAWIDARGMKGFNKASPNGVIQSETFIQNTGMLVRWLKAQP